MTSEAQVLTDVLLALSRLQTPSGDRACVVWRETVGRFRELHGVGVVSVGVPGMPDVCGVLRDGRFLGVECKSPRGRLRDAQERFRDVLRGMGGLYVVARSADDATAAVLEALGAGRAA